MAGKGLAKKAGEPGSALILAVVLTSLLAVIGVVFVMITRVNKIAASAIAENRQLGFAVDSIVVKISQQLALDVPGASETADAEYYDYPGPNDVWLASFEPDYNTANSGYYWRQISDVTGFLGNNNFKTTNVDVKPVGLATTKYVREYPKIRVDSGGKFLKDNGSLATEGLSADADGDGVADSKWFELEDVTGGKGQSIYAAVRIIDNSGMLNLNTAYKFDLNDIPADSGLIDGSSQLQINLEALVRGADTLGEISLARSGSENPTEAQLLDYQENCIWRMNYPHSDYLPFDISDELELRNRLLCTSPTEARIEQKDVWNSTLDADGGIYAVLDVPVGQSSTLDNWQSRMDANSADDYDRRHILTTYNIDRIIDPCGLKMLNVNPDPAPDKLDTLNNDYSETLSREKARNIYAQLVKSIGTDVSDTVRLRMKRTFAQLAVNLVDFRDTDTDVTSLNLATLDADEFGGQDEYYYGIEPYPVITKIGIYIDPCDPSINPNYYAVELFMPFDIKDLDGVEQLLSLDDFWLLVTDFNEPEEDMDMNTPGSVVMERIWLKDLAPFGMSKDDYAVIFNAVSPNMPVDAGADILEDANFILSSGYLPNPDGSPGVLDPDVVDAHNVTLMRDVEVETETGTDTRSIFVDRQLVYKNWVKWDGIDATRYYERDFQMEANPWWYVVYPGLIRDVNGANIMGSPDRNPDKLTPDPKPSIDISLPWNDDDGRLELVTVGDIARVWTVGPRDYLYDPRDANDVFESGGIFDPNTVKPADACDVNGIFAGYSSYTRTVPEKLKYASMDPQLDLEELIRINLADPDYRNLFQYITVFDPSADNIDNDGDGQIDEDGELKVPGRININTAPWYVLAQLPWMRPEIAQAITAYRDKSEIDVGAGMLKYNSDPNIGRFKAIDDQINPRFRQEDIREDAGFESIGELAMVLNNDGYDDYSMRHYILGTEEGVDLVDFPDLTNYDNAGDEAIDDFEERDVIFSRISNLVTVRSDVFTAYILVRLGADGPQKRVIAIFDRSDVYSGDGRVKVVALHPVPDPR